MDSIVLAGILRFLIGSVAAALDREGSDQGHMPEPGDCRINRKYAQSGFPLARE
jgi:hypothetical protein